MALTQAQGDEALVRYGRGESIDALAKSYNQHPNAVRYALGKRDAFNGARQLMHDPERPTDDELGIGVDDEAPADPLLALLGDPRVAALIEKAVEARMSQMGAPSQAPIALSSDAFDKLGETLSRLIELNQIQQPGYQKPLPPAEIERRMAGKVEMDALLRDYQLKGLAPLYTVGEQGFFECTNAAEFGEGARIRTFLPPAEDFIPENEPAAKVHAAMMQWIGGPTPHIGDQVEAAQRAANGGVPLVSSVLDTVANPSPVELVAPPPSSAPRTRRAMGTIQPERHNVGLAERASGPATGPQFVDASSV